MARAKKPKDKDHSDMSDDELDSEIGTLVDREKRLSSEIEQAERLVVNLTAERDTIRSLLDNGRAERRGRP